METKQLSQSKQMVSEKGWWKKQWNVRQKIQYSIVSYTRKTAQSLDLKCALSLFLSFNIYVCVCELCVMWYYGGSH